MEVPHTPNNVVSLETYKQTARTQISAAEITTITGCEVDPVIAEIGEVGGSAVKADLGMATALLELSEKLKLRE